MSTIGASELVESKDYFVVIELDIFKLELKISSIYLAVFDIVFYVPYTSLVQFLAKLLHY